MSRLMSVTLTEQAVRERRKTVTRRLGWRQLQPGDRLTLCPKVMGRRKGEPLVRICDVEVVSVRRERLNEITDEDVAREGFTAEPDDPWPPSAQFVAFFVEHMRCKPDTEVTRIEWRYLDDGLTVRTERAEAAAKYHYDQAQLWEAVADERGVKLSTALMTIERVRSRHQRVNRDGPTPTACSACVAGYDPRTGDLVMCAWPCPTIATLEDRK